VAQKQAEIIQENLKRAGITMEIALLEVGAFDEKRKALQFDAAEGRWSGRVDPDGNMFLHMVTGAGNNWGKYSNPRMDEILRAARTAGSQAERKRLYGDAMRLIIDDVPIIFLHHDAWSKAWDARVQGYVEIPDGRMRLERVWMGK
jgi:peptide/nickel transport system substrate-binding protein